MQEKDKEVMEEKAKEEAMKVVRQVENKDNDLKKDVLPGWGTLTKVGEATSRQLSRLELANKK